MISFSWKWIAHSNYYEPCLLSPAKSQLPIFPASGLKLNLYSSVKITYLRHKANRTQEAGGRINGGFVNGDLKHKNWKE